MSTSILTSSFTTSYTSASTLILSTSSFTTSYISASTSVLTTFFTSHSQSTAGTETATPTKSTILPDRTQFITTSDNNIEMTTTTTTRTKTTINTHPLTSVEPRRTPSVENPTDGLAVSFPRIDNYYILALVYEADGNHTFI